MFLLVLIALVPSFLSLILSNPAVAAPRTVIDEQSS